MSASSATPNAIIQKIPVARTQLTEDFTNSTTQHSVDGNEAAFNNSTTNISLPSTTENILLFNTSTSEPSNLLPVTSFASNDKLSSSELSVTTSMKPDIITTVDHVPEISDILTQSRVKCPELSTLPDINVLTQDEFITKLTDSCRYDRLIRPPSSEPLEVDFQIDMMHIESYEHLVSNLQIIIKKLIKDLKKMF